MGAVAAGLALAATTSSATSLGGLVTVGVFGLIYLVMLGVDSRSAMRAFGQRRFMGVAIGLNFVINPALAWALGQVFLHDQPELRIGLVLFLVTPCIGWYLIFTELADGDTNLGVSVLGVNLVLQVALLPVYLLVIEGRTIGLDLTDVLESITLFLLAPAALAAATHRTLRHRDQPVEAVHDAVDRFHVKTITLVAIIVAMFASQGETVFENPSVVLRLVAPMTAFFALAFLLAVGAGRAAGLPTRQVVLLVFTTTSRNSEASLAIAATAFSSPLVALTVVIGPVIELPLLVLMVRVLLRMHGPRPDSSRRSDTSVASLSGPRSDDREETWR